MFFYLYFVQFGVVEKECLLNVSQSRTRRGTAGKRSQSVCEDAEQGLLSATRARWPVFICRALTGTPSLKSWQESLRAVIALMSPFAFPAGFFLSCDRRAAPVLRECSPGVQHGSASLEIHCVCSTIGITGTGHWTYVSLCGQSVVVFPWWSLFRWNKRSATFVSWLF